MRTFHRLDLSLAVLLFVAAATGGAAYVARWGGNAIFYQELLAPSAMFACGRGLTNVHLPSAPRLDDFLKRRTPALACEDIPADAVTGRLDYLHLQGPYLMYLIGWAWRLQGVSWQALQPLYGLFFATSAVACFGLFRFVLRRWWALAATLLLITSPLQLTNLPHLRDYAKAPFILLLLLLAGLIAARLTRTRSILACAASAGLILGLGVGVRADVLATAPILAVAIFWSRPQQRPWLTRGLTAFTMAATLLLTCGVTNWLVAANVLAIQSSRGPATSMQGLAGRFDTSLGVRAGLTMREYQYHDALTYVTAQSDYTRRRGIGVVERASGDAMAGNFAAATRDYWHTELMLFPADVLVRSYAALIRILDLPFAGVMPAYARTFSLYAMPYASVPQIGLGNPTLNALWALRGRLLSVFSSLGLWILVAAVTGVAVTSPWRACALAALTWYLAIVASQQFDPRNVFYLEIVPLWLFAVAANRAAAAIRFLRAQGWHPALSSGALLAPIGRSLATLASLVIIASLLLTTLRAEQQGTWTRLIGEQVGRTDVQPLAVTREDLSPAPDRLVRLAPVGLPAQPAVTLKAHVVQTLATEYLRADIDTTACTEMPRSWRVHYKGDFAEGFSYDLDVSTFGRRMARGKASVFFPIYYMKSPDFSVGFDSLLIRSANDACVPVLSRMASLQPIAFMATLVVPADWRSQQLYQTFEREDWRVSPLANLASLWLPAPRFLLNQEIDGWTLLGYDVDPAHPDDAARVPLRLHWLAPGGSAPEATYLFTRAGGRHWTQLIDARVVGLRFADAKMQPAFDLPMEGLRRQRIELQPAAVSDPIPVVPHTWYLGTVWTQAPTSTAYVGIHWAPHERPETLTNSVHHTDWVSYSRLANGADDELVMRMVMVSQQPPEVAAAAAPAIYDLGVRNYDNLRRATPVAAARGPGVETTAR
jgi:hypothetical protein